MQSGDFHFDYSGDINSVHFYVMFFIEFNKHFDKNNPIKDLYINQIKIENKDKFIENKDKFIDNILIKLFEMFV